MQFSLERLTSRYIKFNIYYMFWILLLFTCAFAYAIIEFPVFFFSDQHNQITNLLTHDISFFFNPSIGRFRPLSYAEYYFILTSGLPNETIQYLMYLIQASEFILFSMLFFCLVRTVSNFSTAIFTTFAVYTFGMKHADFYTLFSHTIFQEQIVTLFLCASLLLYFYTRKKIPLYTNIQIFSFFFLSLVCAIIATYYKEPTFAFLFAFAFLQIVFRYKKLVPLEKTYLFALLLNSIIFITIYFAFFYTPNNYAVGRVQTPLLETICGVIVRKDSFLLYAIAVAMIRSFIIIKALIIKRDNSKFTDADAILASALSYAFVILVLNLNTKYYFMPSFVFVCVAFSMYVYSIYVFLNKWIHDAHISRITFDVTNFSFQIVRDNVKKSYSYKYQYLAILLMTVLGIVVSAQCYKNYKRFPRYTYKENKINNAAVINLIHDLKQAQHNVITYQPSQRLYPYSYAFQAADWYAHIVNIPYQFTFLQDKDTQAIEKFSEDSSENFFQSLDSGNIAFFHPKFIATNIDIRTFEERYRSFNLFSSTKLYYDKDYAFEIDPILCDFIEDIYHADEDNFKTLFKTHYKDAKALQCPFLTKKTS